jgi:hypothetical protein
MESRSRWIAVGLALLAAFLFALSVQSTWWSITTVTIGPFGTRNCPGGADECGLGWLGNHDLFMRAAVGTRAGGYIAMFAYIMIAGAIAAKRRPTLLARMGIVAILTAAAAAVTFFVKFPGAAFGEPGLGAGPFLFAGAVVAGVTASVLVLRQPVPSQREQR